MPDAQQRGNLKDLSRRLDESEARVAALRVRVDAHDGRFGSIGERAEASCQQAVEAMRQATLRQREEMICESDCQIRILRQRIDTLSELCDELMFQQRQVNPHKVVGNHHVSAEQHHAELTENYSLSK